MAGLGQRIARWFRQDEVSYLYLLTPDVMLTMAPPPHPALRLYVCDLDNLVGVRAAIPDFPACIEARVHRGDLALLAATDTEWVFRSTAVLGPRTYPVTGHPLVLSASDAYLEFAETIPSWRGQGVAPGMLGPTARELVARGITRVYMTICVHNTASCRAAEKGGARRLGIITGRRRLGRWRSTYVEFASEAVRRVA